MPNLNPGARSRELLQELLGRNNGPHSAARERELLSQLRSSGAEGSGELDDLLLQELRRLVRGLEEARRRQDELVATHRRLTAPPYFPAIVLAEQGQDGDRRLLVTHGGALRSVSTAPEMDGQSVGPGDEVLLGNQLNVVIGVTDRPAWRAGETAVFLRYADGGRLVLKWRDEEIIADPSRRLAEIALRQGDRVRWDRQLFLAFERIPREENGSLFLQDTPSERFDAIGGLDRQIAELQRAVRLHFEQGDRAARYGLRRKGSVLLVGPPGTGKTLTARALAGWLATLSPAGRSRFINVKPTGLHSMWYGQSEANYREAFRVAREAGDQDPDVPVVMFFDEVDAIGRARGGALQGVDDRVLTAFMAELDGLESRGNVLVVAATNRCDALDPALLRPGRLGDLVLAVPRPDRRAARAILDRHVPAAVPCAEAPLGGSRDDLLASAISRMFAPNGLGPVATLTCRDGRRRTVRPADLVSGALLAQVAQRALERACVREMESGSSGVRHADFAEAVALTFGDAAGALTPASCGRILDGLPQDVDVVRVELAGAEPKTRGYRTVAVA
jgi:proteasome-associated ATPase